MATTRQLETLDKYVDVMYELILDQVSAYTRSSTRQLRNNAPIFCRMFSQLLYEAPKIFTGQVSVDMVDQKLHDFSAKPCAEHYLSRQRGGVELVKLIHTAVHTCTEPTRSMVFNIALSHTAVHYTTAEENEKLRSFQRVHLDEIAYQRAGITLLEARDLFTKRGHSNKWKEQMRTKYSPIVQHYLTSSSLIKDNQYSKDNNEARNL